MSTSDTPAAAQSPEYVRRIAPYLPGKPIAELAREYGLAEHSIVKLASNENPRGPSPRVRQAIADAAAGIMRYPDGNGFALKNAIAARFAVAPNQVVLGNGSNDVLELATQAFLRPGDEAIFARYAFAVYPLATQARGAIGIEVQTRDFGHDLDAMRCTRSRRARASCIHRQSEQSNRHVAGAASVARVHCGRSAEHHRHRRRGVQRISGERAQGRYCGVDCGNIRNLALFRAHFPRPTASPDFACGYGFDACRPSPTCSICVRQPFNVSSIAQAAALAALADAEYIAESVRLNHQGLGQLMRGLDALGIAYVPSHGNFLLIHVGDAGAIYDRLLRQGVIVRPVSNYKLPEHLRITVGLPAENTKFLEALQVALNAAAERGARVPAT